MGVGWRKPSPPSRTLLLKKESSLSKFQAPCVAAVLTLSSFTLIENTEVSPFVSGLFEGPRSPQVPTDYAQHFSGWHTKLFF